MNIEHTIQVSEQTGLSKVVDKECAKRLFSFANRYIQEFYSTSKEPKNTEKDFLVFLAITVGSTERINKEDKIRLFDAYNELARRFSFTPINYDVLMQ
jgi:hypothetical protein